MQHLKRAVACGTRPSDHSVSAYYFTQPFMTSLALENSNYREEEKDRIKKDIWYRVKHRRS